MCDKFSQVPMISPLQVSDLGMQFDPSRQSNSSEEHDVELSQLDRSSSRESKVVTEIMIISGFRFRIMLSFFWHIHSVPCTVMTEMIMAMMLSMRITLDDTKTMKGTDASFYSLLLDFYGNILLRIYTLDVTDFWHSDCDHARDDEDNSR